MKDYTLARPYARAAYLFAKEHDVVAEWNDFLRALCGLMQEEHFLKIVQSPHFDAQVFIQIVTEKLQGDKNAYFSNFLNLLAENHRLTLLPEIFELFAMDAKENTLREISVKSAMPLTPQQMSEIEKTMQQKFGQSVTLHVHEDATLIGGVIIETGDYVLDASLIGQLQRLKNTLTL